MSSATTPTARPNRPLGTARAAALRRLAGAAVSALVATCGPQAVVSSGSASPPADDPFGRMEQRIAAVAYEFGLCEHDADCAPRGCGGAVCSTNDEPAVCNAGDVAACFATVPSQHCGCVDGACRWDRTAPVMQCSQLASERASNRPFRPVDGLGEMYPIRNGE